MTDTVYKSKLGVTDIAFGSGTFARRTSTGGSANITKFGAIWESLLDDQTAATAMTTLGISAFAQTLIDDADADAARTTLGVVAAAFIRGGDIEIDGDKLDIDWNPSNYTPATTPTQVSNADELTAHLYGIDAALEVASSAEVTAGTDTVKKVTPSNLAGIMAKQSEWTKLQNYDRTQLTSGDSVAWAANSNPAAYVTLDRATTTIGAPSGLAAGAFILLELVQDGTGSRAVAWNAVFNFQDDVAPDIATAASEKTLMGFYSPDGTNLYGWRIYGDS